MISLNEEFSLSLTISLFHKIHIGLYTNDRASLMIQSVKTLIIIDYYIYLNCSFLFPCMVCEKLGQTYWQEHKQD